MVFDFCDKEIFRDKVAKEVKPFLIRAAKGEEPFLTGFSYDEISELVRECGFKVDETLGPEQQGELIFKKSPLKGIPHFSYIKIIKL